MYKEVFPKIWEICISIFRYKRPKQAVGALHFYTSSERIARVASCIEPYFCIEPELAYRLQTSKMRRNPTSLNSCQQDDINIVTISVVRRRWTAPLKPRRPYVKHFTTFYTLVKYVSPKRKEVIFAACIYVSHLFRYIYNTSLHYNMKYY